MVGNTSVFCNKPSFEYNLMALPAISTPSTKRCLLNKPSCNLEKGLSVYMDYSILYIQHPLRNLVNIPCSKCNI